MTKTDVERRLSLALESHKHLLPDVVVHCVSQNIYYDELGLALEVLVDAIIEDEHPISTSDRKILRVLITELSEYPREHLRLLEKYCPVSDTSDHNGVDLTDGDHNGVDLTED